MTTTDLTKYHSLFRDIVAQSRLSMVASDLRLPDAPLVFVNDAFVEMTGHSREDVIGRNCRFLQGTDTDPETVREVREAIEAGRDGYFELLNYRADGTKFWNGLHIGPMTDENGEPGLFFGAQRDVTADVEARTSENLQAREMAHRMGNLLAIVATMVRNSARGEGEDALRDALETRLLALSQSNALVSPKPDPKTGMRKLASAPLTVLLRTVLAPLAADDRFTLSGPLADVAAGDVTNAALVVHELSTNALKHGTLGDDGRVKVEWLVENERIAIDWHETGSVGADDNFFDNAGAGMGRRLLETIARSSSRTDAGYAATPQGLIFRFDVAAA